MSNNRRRLNQMHARLARERQGTPEPPRSPVTGKPPICSVRMGQQECEFWTDKEGVRRCWYCCKTDPRQTQ